jgi:hypothetical protein
MHALLRNAVFIAVVGALPGATAAPLTVVTVSAPEINCVFETDCSVAVTDTVGTITMPGTTGTARLQSRTFVGKPGAPGDGKTAYEYRLDLTQATTQMDASCLTGLEVDFGPVAKLQYNKSGAADDVFVVTKGGLGTIGLAAAEQNGDVITFAFTQPVCAADTGAAGKTTFFFGLASAKAPKGIVATVDMPGVDDPIKVKARAPAD